MSKSKRVTITRPNITTVWPFDQFIDVADTNWNFLESIGITTHINGSENNDLSIVVDHMHTDDALFDEYNLYSEHVIPIWQNDTNKIDADAYCAANNIAVTMEIVVNPDLTGYELVTQNRRIARSN